MPDFATLTGNTVTLNQNVEIKTVTSPRLSEAIQNMIDVAKEETGLNPQFDSPAQYAVYHGTKNECGVSVVTGVQ